MLTEQYVRDTFAKYFNDPSKVLTSEPFHESCMLVHYTQEELEQYVQMLSSPPSFEIFQQLQALEDNMLERAVTLGEYDIQKYLTVGQIPYEESAEYRVEQLKLAQESK